MVLYKNNTLIKKVFGALVIGALSISIWSCGSIPQPSLETTLLKNWRNQINPSAESIPQVHTNWWENLNDPLLNEIVALALHDNLSIEQSYARVNAERELEKATLASQKPQFGFYFGPNSSVQFANYHSSTAFLVGFDMSWEIPYTVKQAAQKQIAKAKIEEAKANLLWAKSSVVAEVVRVYGDYRASQKKLAVLEKMVQYQAAIVKILTRSASLGAVSEEEVLKASSRLFELQTVHDDLALIYESNLQRLDVLCGLSSPPTSWEDSVKSPWTLQSGPVHSFEIPAAMVLSRPDVVSAKESVFEMAGQVGVARGELYPKMDIEGAVLYSGTLIERSTTSTPEGLISFIAPSVHFPIYDWGMKRYQKNALENELRRSIASYKEVVLQAIADTELAIVNFNSADQRLLSSLEEAKRLNIAAERNTESLSLGHASPLDVFESNIKLLERKIATIDSESNWLSAYAGVNKVQTDMQKDEGQYLSTDQNNSQSNKLQGKIAQ